MKIERLMTCDVVSVSPDTPLKDVAALLSEKHISGLPVCTTDGRVVGVISEAYDELSDEIRDEVPRGALWIAPDTLALSVEDGVVTVSGPVGSELELETVLRSIRQVPGVVDVHSELHTRAGKARF